MNSLEAIIILNMLPTIGPATANQLLKIFDSPEAIFAASDSTLKKYIKDRQLDAIVNWQNHIDIKKELHHIKTNDIQLLSILDQNYPPLLKEIHAPPILLYIKGNLHALNGNIISIVGSRKASLYGISTAEKLAKELVSFNISIASGLALGIDTAAHRGALECDGITVAVLGNGLSEIYPKDNQELATMITKKNGAIISEFPMTMPPLAKNFPRRNRIVSGLSLGVIVTEAAKKSGALITANMALDEGRLVFSVPGKIDSVSAGGTNELIKQGAKLVTCVSDILEEFEHIDFKQQKIITENKKLSDLTTEENTILNILTNEEMNLDTILAQTAMPLPIIINSLLTLELKRLIKQLPGKKYVRHVSFA